MSNTGRVIPRRYRGLVMLNFVALAGLVLVTFASDATGQPSRQRVAGEYTMISGRMQGQTKDAIFIIDARNREMLALSWDRGQARMAPIGAGYRNFDYDSTENARRSR